MSTRSRLINITQIPADLFLETVTDLLIRGSLFLIKKNIARGSLLWLLWSKVLNLNSLQCHWETSISPLIVSSDLICPLQIMAVQKLAYLPRPGDFYLNHMRQNIDWRGKVSSVNFPTTQPLALTYTRTKVYKYRVRIAFPIHPAEKQYLWELLFSRKSFTSFAFVWEKWLTPRLSFSLAFSLLLFSSCPLRFQLGI